MLENKNKLLKMIKKGLISEDTKPSTSDLLKKCLSIMSYGQVNDMVTIFNIPIHNTDKVEHTIEQ